MRAEPSGWLRLGIGFLSSTVIGRLSFGSATVGPILTASAQTTCTLCSRTANEISGPVLREAGLIALPAGQHRSGNFATSPTIRTAWRKMKSLPYMRIVLEFYGPGTGRP